MSSVRLRLLLRDTTAVTAFAAMAISGQLSIGLVVSFVLAACSALLGFRLQQNWLNRTVAVMAAVVLGFMELTGRIDTVVGAASLAAILSMAMLHAEPTQIADAQLHLLALLMVSAAAALSADIWYFVCVVAFACLATFSLGAGVLEASAKRMGEPTPWRPGFRRLALGLVATLVGSAVFFLTFPRLSWNMAARQSGPSGPAVSGFSGEVKLGEAGGASIKVDPRPVLRAHLTPDPRRSQLDAYWFGKALDSFDGSSWSSRHRREGGKPSVTLQAVDSASIEQEIELLAGYGSSTLVALETPVEFVETSIPSGFGITRPPFMNVPDEQVRMQNAMPGLTYRVRSMPDAAVPLVRARADDYLRLPANLDPRVTQLAERVVGGEKDPARAARLLVRHLKEEYRYTLDLPAAGTSDPLGDFLFQRKQGHCEHFATALAVMLRTQGFPSRVVTGFFGGERVDDVYVVRAADAHAWVQVLVPQRGFVTFDATPDAFRSGQPSVVLTWFARQYEVIERVWRTRVLDYSIVDQARFAQQAFERLRPKPPEVSTSPRKLPDPRPLLGIALIAAISYAVYRWGRRAPRAEETARLGVRLRDLLSRASFPLRPSESIEDYAVRLRHSTHPLAMTLPRILRRYLEARFGARPLEVGEADALLNATRAALSRADAPIRRAA